MNCKLFPLIGLTLLLLAGGWRSEQTLVQEPQRAAAPATAVGTAFT